MKKRIIKLIIFLIITLSSFIYTLKKINNITIDLDKETLNILLESSDTINSKNRIINKIVSTIKDTNIINPISIVLQNYNKKVEIKKINQNNNENNNENVKIEEIRKPRIYIYNTHQNEKYISTKDININYTVLDASFYLQKRLKEYGLESIVETSSIQDILNTNNWNYASSYRVSRMYLEKRKKENDSLTLFIDLHRDSVNKKISTISINNKKYAKTMFLLGLENKNYKNNEKILNKLENWLNKNYEGLSRGIYEKKGKGVNGIYNQDFSEYCILIEVGGEENTYEEVENSIDVIAEMIIKNFGDLIV